jgi:hypothetical protein
LTVQKVGERTAAACQIDGVGGFFAVVLARCGVAAPFAVVGAHVHAAVAVPTFGHVGHGLVACFAGAVVAAAGRAGAFAHPVAQADMGVGLVQAKGFGWRFFFGALQKRVLVQHLVDFLRQLQRGQLQQADRLLQLGRERQMLGHAQ